METVQIHLAIKTSKASDDSGRKGWKKEKINLGKVKLLTIQVCAPFLWYPVWAEQPLPGHYNILGIVLQHHVFYVTK